MSLVDTGIDARIVDFIDILRHNGVRVSLSENLDALGALSEVAIADRGLVKDALRTTLIKSAYDISTFDQLFDLYFTGLVDTFRAATDAVQGKLFEDSSAFQEFLDGMDETMDHSARRYMGELAEALMRNDTGSLEQMIRSAAARAGIKEISNFLQEGYYAYKILEEMGWQDAREQLERFRDSLLNQDIEGEELDVARDYVNQRIADFQETVREYVRRELEKNNFDQRNRFRKQSFEEKSFYALTESEIARMKEVIQQLAQKLKAQVALRRKRSKHGRFNVNQTLRKNMSTGGVPFKIIVEKRKKLKPQVVILCDVSDSVRMVSKFMLQFVYSLQDLYSKVRSFIFVAELGEITQFFREREVYDAMDLTQLSQVIPLYANSNFGQAFAGFHRDFLHSVNKDTTVIVLGDGRNNYNPPQAWALRDIQAMAKRLIWLNPESARSWGLGDSEMWRYARHCDTLLEVRNLKQLRRAIDKLLPDY